MRNFTLKILVALTIFVIFVNNGSNANTVIIEATFKKNDPGKELVARQESTIKCIGYFEGDEIKKAPMELPIIEVPKDAIYATLTAECSSKSVTVEPDNAKSKLEKYMNKQFFPMKRTFPGVKQLGIIGVSPKNVGSFVIGRFLLWADPSECLNASPEGLLGVAQICMTFNINAPGYETILNIPCAKQGSIVRGCPPASSPDEILREKLEKLLQELAKYFSDSESRFEKVDNEFKERAKKLAECFKNIALSINVTVNENDDSCVSCDEMDALSNINGESELPQDRIKIVQSLLKKLKDAYKCKFDICLNKNSCKENKSVSNDGISGFSRGALAIMGIPLYIMINQ